ncbi:hypothetical protein ACOTC5_29880 [Achromobacter xylosoxidans]
MSIFEFNWESQRAARRRLLHDRATMLAVALLLALVGTGFLYMADHHMSPDMARWARNTILVMIGIPYGVLVIYFLWSYLSIENQEYGVK